MERSGIGLVYSVHEGGAASETLAMTVIILYLTHLFFGNSACARDETFEEGPPIVARAAYVDEVLAHSVIDGLCVGGD